MPNVTLSVVIPTFNETASIKRGNLEQVYQYLSAHYRSFEILIVDDGSTDRSKHHLKKFAQGKSQVRVIFNPHQGKGPTLVTGMLNAKGMWRLFTDMDQSTPIAEIKKLTPHMSKGYQVVVGSRMIAGAKRANNPLYRKLMGQGFSLLVHLLAVRGIKDTQCGFKLFSKDAANVLFSNLYVYAAGITEKRAYTGAIDVELLYIAQKLGYQIKEVPVIWTHVDSTRVNPVIDSIRMLTDVLKIRLADLAGKYGTQNSPTAPAPFQTE